jgi:hypothetical protein
MVVFASFNLFTERLPTSCYFFRKLAHHTQVRKHFALTAIAGTTDPFTEKGRNPEESLPFFLPSMRLYSQALTL